MQQLSNDIFRTFKRASDAFKDSEYTRADTELNTLGEQLQRLIVISEEFDQKNANLELLQETLDKQLQRQLLLEDKSRKDTFIIEEQKEANQNLNALVEKLKSQNNKHIKTIRQLEYVNEQNASSAKLWRQKACQLEQQYDLLSLSSQQQINDFQQKYEQQQQSSQEKVQRLNSEINDFKTSIKDLRRQNTKLQEQLNKSTQLQVQQMNKIQKQRVQISDLKDEITKLLDYNKARLKQENEKVIKDIKIIKKNKNEFQNSDLSETIYKQIGKALNTEIQPKNSPAMKSLDEHLKEVQEKLINCK